MGTSTITGLFGTVGTATFTGGHGIVGTTTITGLFGVAGTSVHTGTFNSTGIFNIQGTANFTGIHGIVGTTLVTGLLGLSGTAAFTGTFGVVGTSTFTGTMLVPLIAGGPGAASTLTLESTTGAGTTDAVIMNTGSQVQRLKIDTQGAVIVGGNYGAALVAQNAYLNVQSIDGGPWQLALEQYNNSLVGAAVLFQKSRGATVGAHGLVQNNDKIGAFDFKGSNGSLYGYVAWMDAFVDGVASASSLPGRMVFATTPAGQTTVSPERLRISSDGSLLVNQPNNTDAPEAYLQINQTNSSPWTVELDVNTNDVVAPSIMFRKSRGVTLNAVGTVSVGDGLGGLFFKGTDGTTERHAGRITCEVAAGLTATSVPGRMAFLTTVSNGGTIERMSIDAPGNVIIGTTAIASAATDGFLYLPTTNGTPTGTPTTYSNRSPMIIDSTNNRLYFYSSGAWRNAGP